MSKVCQPPGDLHLYLLTTVTPDGRGEKEELMLIKLKAERMLGTFNQHLPMILSNNYWHQSRPTSLHDTGMGVG